ncbi:MAG: LytTR family transcriptional regulator DNA-binding domain-containing protein [Defluviitaleaceae bacterium]|nr:LytTR family transcriptional regulator DNA-binding domain-containing protein [Defluviitaleaceae bacterium]
MIVKLVQDMSVAETEILIKYNEMTEDVIRVTEMIKSATTRIKCTCDSGEKLVNVSDIYYFESVDKMTFVYCGKEVYKTDIRLYQIVNDFGHLGFVQISKSCVLNMNALDSVSTLPNSRMEATLKNNEKVHVSRKYLENIKSALYKGV